MENLSYKTAGVNIHAGYEAVKLMGEYTRKTKIEGVLDEIGGFGGLFAPNLAGLREPVLVSGTDGVGTKIRLAFLRDEHDTVGIDCVAMSVNDVVCCGAKPLFFLDYIATGKVFPEKMAQIVKGVSEGCVKAGCALIGGETAEHPGLMPKNEYDLAGFCVGIVDKEKIIDGKDMVVGDKIIALASSGVHSNGFSLINKVFGVDELKGEIGGVLMTPTRIYVKSVLKLTESVKVKGVAHITGGGFYENIPRAVKNGLGAFVEKKLVKTQEIFEIVREKGNVLEHDMWNTYNMGVGMIVIVSAKDEKETIDILRGCGEDAYTIGEVRADEGLLIV